jgi:lysozyme
MSNRDAFLAMIRFSEGTASAPDPYAVTFGYHFTITDFSDHPAVLGDWLGPLYAGKVSTAAGAYQIIRPTWVAIKNRQHLPDFSPASQDAAALALVSSAGALQAVDAGAIDAAINICRHIWASLPGAGAGQPERPLLALENEYTQAGGVLA